MPLRIADNDQRAEAEPPATLDDLGAAIDMDDLLDQLAATAFRFAAEFFSDTRDGVDFFRLGGRGLGNAGSAFWWHN